MASFDDWLTASDPAIFAENLAEQFRLTQIEVQKAQEALQPAFALGLQRAMTSPSAWSDLTTAFAAMAPGGAAASSPQTKPGEAFMQAIFGSDALTAAISRHASLFAGIAPGTMQQMMPSLAMMTMETLVRSTLAGIAGNQPPGLATGDYGSATAEMMRRGANAVEALTHPSDRAARRSGPGLEAFTPMNFATAFTDALKTPMPWMPQAPSPQTVPPRNAPEPAAPEGFNPILPFAGIFEAFTAGMQAAQAPAPTPKSPQAKPSAPSPAAAPSEDEPALSKAVPPKSPEQDNIVEDLFRSGKKFQEEYAKEMANLFERYQGAAKSG